MPSEAEQLQIPTTVADVTPAWLTAALADRFPGSEVASVQPEGVHDGTASTTRLHVEYATSGPAGPPTMCVKASIESPHREFVLKAGLFVKEALVYRELLPAISARVADCYASASDAETGTGFLLLEDLDARGARFCSAEEPLTPDQVAEGLDQLAALHSLHWGDPEITEPRWRHRGRRLDERDPLEARMLALVPAACVTPHGGAVSHRFHDPEVLGPAIARLRTLDAASATCLIHGDGHIGNFFLDADDRPGMADFQCVQRGHYSHDVAMFVGSALDPIDRRAHEERLVTGYLDSLARRGVTPPTFDEAWLGYRRHILYGLWAWLLTTSLYQSELRLVTCVFRYGTAAVDLDSPGAIGAT